MDTRSPPDQFRYLMSGTEDARQRHRVAAGCPHERCESPALCADERRCVDRLNLKLTGTTTMRGWKEAKQIHWFVAGGGGLFLSTSSATSKRNAIKAFLKQANDNDEPEFRKWPYWYRHGFRAVRAKIKFKVLP